MAYQKDDLVIVLAQTEDDPPVYDTRVDPYKELKRGAYLPHSCDDWVIGGPDNIRTLILDLQRALQKLES